MPDMEKPPAPPVAPRAPGDAASGVAMVVVWAAVLHRALSGSALLDVPVIAALGLFLLVQARRLPMAAWGHLVCGAVTAAGAVLVLDEPWPVLLEGLHRAAFLAALFAALGSLREAARTSRVILETGRMLVRQPPGRRYAAITTGGSLFGAILNFGAVSLLGGMVKDVNTLEAAGGDERVRAIREKRMLMAVLRGFSTLMLWSPLTVAYALVGAVVPAASLSAMAVLGGVATVAVLAIGWAVDRMSMPPSRRAPGQDVFAWRRLAPVVGLIALVFGLSIMVEEITRARLIDGVILTVPFLALAWIVAGDGAGRGLSRLGRYVCEGVPTQRTEVAILGNAAFLGAVIAALLPEAGVGGLVSRAAIPSVVVAALIPWLVALAGQAAINPFITVAVLVALLGEPAALGLDPTVLGLGLVMGWGLTVGSSPVTASTMIVGTLAGQSPGRIGRGWNGLHTLLSLAFCSAFLAVLHALW